MEIEKFKHKIIETVRFHEVDILGVCNNAVYFNYFEDARIKYVQYLKKIYKFKELLEGDSFFIMARNECDYVEPATLDDELNVYTRIDFVKKTSFGFRHIVENKRTGRISASGGGVVVHINKKIHKPVPLPEEFYIAIKDFEPEVKIIKGE